MDEMATSDKRIEPSPPELKRLLSVRQMIKTYNQQRFIIKSSLGHLDHSYNHKLIFDDAETSTEQLTPNTINNVSKKKVLFDSDNEDENGFSIPIKKQFDGEKGQQLFQLQSRYKNDERFMLDERFVDNINGDCDTGSKEDEEFTLEAEKKSEIEILQKVLSNEKELKRSNWQDRSSNKPMLRFDPSQTAHLKYQITPTDKEINDKIPCNNENEKIQTTVSNDMFYKVNDTLKDIFQERKEFSLLSAFGQNDEVCDKVQEEQQNIVMKKRLSHLETNEFRYDSSDDEIDCVEYGQNNVNNCDESDFKVQVKTKNFEVVPFFFNDDDFRLQDGSDFVTKTASDQNFEFVVQRKNLKHIIKAKVRNNKKKKDSFKQKVGGRKKKMFIRVRKAMRR